MIEVTPLSTVFFYFSICFHLALILKTEFSEVVFAMAFRFHITLPAPHKHLAYAHTYTVFFLSSDGFFCNISIISQ